MCTKCVSPVRQSGDVQRCVGGRPPCGRNVCHRLGTTWASEVPQAMSHQVMRSGTQYFVSAERTLRAVWWLDAHLVMETGNDTLPRNKKINMYIYSKITIYAPANVYSLRK